MKHQHILFFILSAAILLVSCGSPAVQSVSPGIEGTWMAPLTPNGSITVELHPASGCSPTGPCALTGTLKDNRNGMNGSLSNATLNGTAVEFHPLLKLTQDDSTGTQYDFTGALTPDGISIKGELKIKGTAESTAHVWAVEFKKQ